MHDKTIDGGAIRNEGVAVGRETRGKSQRRP